MVKIILFLILLPFMVIAQEISPEYDIPYDRDLFGDWSDIDRDCINTRHEILIRDAIHFTMDERGCKVVSGMWRDYYTGEILIDVSEIDIDHIVPLKEIWDSGAIYWTTRELKEIFNDESNLVVTHRSINRSKGSDEPHEWDYYTRIVNPCRFIEKWFAFKINYNLYFDEEEINFIYQESGCN